MDYPDPWKGAVAVKGIRNRGEGLNYKYICMQANVDMQ